MAMSWGPIAYGPSCKSARRRSRRLSYDGGLATREQLAVIMDPKPDGLLAVLEHCDLLESLDVGHTLIHMDAVIQVIERNDQLALLRSAHEALTITKDSS